ncbi:hypothetical protein BC936DRAFT_149729 [Jimgerdemannia flammicorona]|uniref:Uncharacterized protein n=1 Tax=Jimgerdemannia flammicorona TaxID=994334 RepID=A0A433D076_9FUNG|nr:hypothetical protein BC936DRAFT_149729 [Jimgerdemannia flammicorona]
MAPTLSDQAPSAINPCWMELYKLEILQRQPRPRDHSISIARTSMRRRTAEIRPSIPSRSQYGIMRLEPMQRPIFLIKGDDAPAHAVFHDEIERKVLNKEVCVVLEGLTVECVKHGVASPIRHRRTPVRLPALAILERLPAKGPLIDLALICAREWDSEVLQFDHAVWGLAAHVVDRVLVTEPVAALDCIVHVPAPVIFAHVAEGCVHAAL